jgi:hypothetical protein
MDHLLGTVLSALSVGKGMCGGLVDCRGMGLPRQIPECTGCNAAIGRC